MKCQKYTARCYRVYQNERNESSLFLSIFKGGGRPNWRFSNFPRFWKNSSALGSFNCIFENNSLKALFRQNMKKVKILKLSPDSRYLQKLALNVGSFLVCPNGIVNMTGSTAGTLVYPSSGNYGINETKCWRITTVAWEYCVALLSSSVQLMY